MKRHVVLLAVVAFLLIGGPSEAAWKRIVKVDRLSDKEEIFYSTQSLAPIRQFERDVTLTLFLRCSVMGGKSAQIVFSERVSVGEPLVRYRFDKNEVVGPYRFDMSERGEAIFLRDDKFMTQITHSSHLRLEMSLPWAGDVLVEFSTLGADKALQALRC